MRSAEEAVFSQMLGLHPSGVFLPWLGKCILLSYISSSFTTNFWAYLALQPDINNKHVQPCTLCQSLLLFCFARNGKMLQTGCLNCRQVHVLQTAFSLWSPVDYVTLCYVTSGNVTLSGRWCQHLGPKRAIPSLLGPSRHRPSGCLSRLVILSPWWLDQI